MNDIIQQDIREVLSKEIPWRKLYGKTVLITGATGMLASYLVYTLLELNKTKRDSEKVHMILAVRNLEKAYGQLGKYAALQEVKVIPWQGKEIQLEKKVNFIIHAASIADSSLYMQYPVETLLPNVIGTYHLLEYARKNLVEGFLFFSSTSAYGRVEGKNFIEENDSGYLNPGEVRSCYGESKRMGENMCVSYAHEYHIPACCVRISHTYGPTMDLERDTRVFSQFVKNVVAGQNIVMKSNGNARRAFCYISDATAAFWVVLLKGIPGQIYNMCNNDCFVSIQELANTLVKLFPEKKLTVFFEQRDKNDSYSENKNANEVKNTNEKLKKLGWNPEVGIEEGFTRTVRSFCCSAREEQQ